MNDEKDTTVISISAKQIGVVMVTILVGIGSNHLDIFADDNANANSQHTDEHFDELQDDIEFLQARADTLEISINNLYAASSQCKERQGILENKMDKCQTNYAGLNQQVKNNGFLINECLRITRP